MRYSITFDQGNLLELSQGINAAVLPLMHQTVKAVAAKTSADWQTAVYKAKLWQGERDAYASSITWAMTGDFSAEVSTDYKHAAEIENGRPARDLKAMLNTSEKVRRTTDGRRFLVIPLRHNTPGHTAHAPAMPDSVYGMASELGASSIVSSWRKRRSGEVTSLSPATGMKPAAKQSPYLSNPNTKQAVTVTRNRYAWGDRLTAGALKGAGLGAADVKRYAGMVKMNTSTPGGSKSSTYLTFRIMIEGQMGWVVPAQPGMYIAQKVAQAMQPKAQAAFEAAMKKTVTG